MIVMRIKTVIIIVIVIYCRHWPEILGRDGQWMEETHVPQTLRVIPGLLPRTVCVCGRGEGETRNG